VLHSLDLVAELDTSTVIALAALALSALSFHRAGAADRRDKQRHELALAEAAARQRAELVLSPIAPAPGDAHPKATVRNIGRAHARHVRAWLADDERQCATSVDGDDGTVMLAPDEKREVEVALGPDDVDVTALRWCMGWKDDAGEHEVVTESRPYRPPPYVPLVDFA
jgi:hypothetical protein